jgi:hypothetical protein
MHCRIYHETRSQLGGGRQSCAHAVGSAYDVASRSWGSCVAPGRSAQWQPVTGCPGRVGGAKWGILGSVSRQRQTPNRRLAFVQLGHVDIDPSRLMGSGTSLISLLGDRVLDVRVPAAHLDHSGDGWRIIHHEPVTGHGGRSEVLAAPH